MGVGEGEQEKLEKNGRRHGEVLPPPIPNTCNGGYVPWDTECSYLVRCTHPVSPKGLKSHRRWLVCDHGRAQD